MHFHPASALPDKMAILPHILDWIWEAGNPYVEWLWGTEAEGKAQTYAWLCRGSSELSLDKITLLMCGEAILGGYLAMGGRDLLTSRKSDLVELLKVAKRTNNASLLKKLVASRELFPPVDEQHYYISRIGVRSQYRGMGFGRKLLEHCLATGRKRDYDYVRLDVCASNRNAISLYRSENFTITQEMTSDSAGMAYYAMIFDMRFCRAE